MKLKLTDNQKKKMYANGIKGVGSKIRIGPEQIGCGIEYPLRVNQIEALKIGKKNGKSVQLDFPISQIKTGGFLPLLFAGIGAAAAALGGVSSVANVYFDKKDKDRIREETERHNKEMEKIIAEKITSVHVGSNLNKKKTKETRTHETKNQQ
uniref:Uncharacterized protein n=1 Tax=Cacopsylla melanoneura TaxID=428564 RepID=A0A8D9E9M2_9HEMI